MANRGERRVLPIMHQNPMSPTAEAFRTIRTNLKFMGIKQETKTILVTSAAVGEGKTSTICNIGVAMAQSGKRVLIIDADLRKPTVHRHFGISNLVGLCDCMIHESSWANCILSTDVPQLMVLPCGVIPPNPSELLESNNFWTLLDEYKQQFDLILIDSPPILSFTDALVVAQGVDGTVLVVNSRKTSRLEVKRAVNALLQVNARILGSVLNRAPYHTKSYKYYTSSPAKNEKTRHDPSPTT